MLPFCAKRIRGLFLMGCLTLFPWPGQSQEYHFSQYVNTPLLVNPALAGYGSSDRLGFSGRSQWSSFPGRKSFDSFSFFYDRKFPCGLKNWIIDQDWLGFGAVLFQDVSGDGLLKTTGIYLPVLAVHMDKIDLFWDKSFHIAFGSGLGIVNRRVDYDYLRFNSQWDGFEYDNQIPSGEGFDPATFSELSLDYSVGALIGFQPNKRHHFSMGAGMFHSQKPGDSFYPNGKNVRKQKVNLHARYYYQTHEYGQFEWTLFHSMQEKANETLIGLAFRRNRLKIGFLDRLERDIILYGTYYFDQFELCASHDFNSSKLSQFHGFGKTGATEVSAIFHFGCNNHYNAGEEEVWSGKSYKPRRQFRERMLIALMCEGYDMGVEKITRNVDYSLFGDVGLGVGLGSAEGDHASQYKPEGAFFPSLHFLASGRVMPGFALGVGFGAGPVDSSTFFSLYGHGRVDLGGRGQKKLSRDQFMPFVFAEGGMLLRKQSDDSRGSAPSGGPLVAGGFGFEVRPGSNWRTSRLFFGLGYRVQEFRYPNILTGSAGESVKVSQHSVFFRGGVKF